MKRIELFEFEDLEWLPKVLRSSITNLIVVFHKLMGTSEVISELILKAKSKNNFAQIVDLGSGSGGVMPEVFKQISKDDEKLKLLLTDLHPNLEFTKEIENLKNQNIEYDSNSVNAENMDNVPGGLKTMIASFHHMPPNTAKKILKSAEENKEPILIYEVAKNSIPVIAWCLFLPISLMILILMSLVMTLFVRPLKLSQLFFTYLIPIIPLIYAWDGQASLMRTYTFEDVKELIGNSNENDYVWTIDDAQKTNGKKLGYFILGYPKK